MKRIHRAAAAAVAVLALSPLAVPAYAQSGHDGHHLVVTPDKLRWTDIPSLPPGAKLAMIEGTLSEAKPFTARLKLPDGFRVPPHIHPAVERLTVLSGTFVVGIGSDASSKDVVELPTGSVIVMQPGTPHFVRAVGETVLQLNTVGPWGITYLNPADDPRKKP